MPNVINEKYSVIGDFEFDALIAGEKQPIITKGITLAAAQGVLSRGTLIGVVTATKLAVLCDSTKSDGSQIPEYILGATCDTGAAGATLNVPTIAYQTGIFNRAAIITAAGQDINAFEQQLRQVGILLRDTIANPTNQN